MNTLEWLRSNTLEWPREELNFTHTCFDIDLGELDGICYFDINSDEGLHPDLKCYSKEEIFPEPATPIYHSQDWLLRNMKGWSKPECGYAIGSEEIFAFTNDEPVGVAYITRDQWIMYDSTESTPPLTLHEFQTEYKVKPTTTHNEPESENSMVITIHGATIADMVELRSLGFSIDAVKSSDGIFVITGSK